MNKHPVKTRINTRLPTAHRSILAQAEYFDKKLLRLITLAKPFRNYYGADGLHYHFGFLKPTGIKIFD